MTLFGKTEEMKKAKIRAFEKKYRKENPKEDKETIHKMAVRKYKHNRRQLMDRAKVAALTMLLTAGVILGAQGIVNSSNADTPQINYEYLSKDQRAFIDSLDGNQLAQYVSDYLSIPDQPERLDRISKKTEEITEHSEDYLNDFREFQEGLLPFMASYQLYPEKYTEDQMLTALRVSNSLLGRYTKNQAVALLYEHNKTNTDNDLIIYIIPDPNNIYFFQGSDADAHMLAECDYTDSGLINKGSLYVAHTYFKDNGFDEAIGNYFKVADYYNDQINSIDENSNNKSHIDKTIEMILHNNEVADQVANTRAVVTKNWFSTLPTWDYEYKDKDKAKDKNNDDKNLTSDASDVSQGIEKVGEVLGSAEEQVLEKDDDHVL